MVRVVSAPDRWKTERLWPNCRHCVFYLFKASLCVYRLHLQWILVIGCFILFLLAFWFGCFLAEGLCAMVFSYQAGFSWLHFAAECWRFMLFFFLFGLFLFFGFLLFPLLKWLSSELELLSITPFSPPVSFPPAFHYVTPPVPAMHLGNQETESDAEDEVNHTLPTLCCPLR